MKAIIKTFILATPNYLKNKSNKPKLSPLYKMIFVKHQTLRHFPTFPIIPTESQSKNKGKRLKYWNPLFLLASRKVTMKISKGGYWGILGYFGAIFYPNFPHLLRGWGNIN